MSASTAFPCHGLVARGILAAAGWQVGLAAAAAPSAQDALKLSPVQRGVAYDYAEASSENSALCSIKAERINGATAWVVRGPDGALLREFSDSNGDNVVDRWSYFQGGVETYRDIDANFNGKADQYRWFQTAGTRWGADDNEDGQIDEWKQISVEEAAEEVVAALAAGDARRFERLLLTEQEIAALGLSAAAAERLEKRLADAPRQFAALLKSQRYDDGSVFTDFGGLRPGMIPQGTLGLKEDLMVYEDAWAMLQNGEKHEQLQLGALVRAGDAWKLTGAPTPDEGEQQAQGLFYQVQRADAAAVAGAAPSAEMEKVLEQIEQLDRQLVAAPAAERAPLHAQRADLLEKLAALAPSPADRDQWLRQLGDMLSAAIQDGTYPDGMPRLEKLAAQLADDKASAELATTVEFRRMQAAYGLALADPKAEAAKVQEQWLKDLESFVDTHDQSDNVAEALLQLAMASEFAAEFSAAEKWYGRIVKDFPQSPNAPKARGAMTRLTCAGKPLAVKGPSLQGGVIDLAQYRGRAVLLHYWTSTAPTCEADHKQLVELYKKFGGAKFSILGVCLDNSREEAVDYLKAHKLPWHQLFEPGGFDGRLANEMGIVTAPLLILVDGKGEGVNANIQMAELETALRTLIPSQVASSKK